ncbi:hypothetical protein G7Z17_g8069 [Cylindrodendrum hubeiense]|uniref:NAD(P)-binding domain-containing protein n=1 Tax=Cylindrodendrum hubeiense TaxID=595255 RepID=A0A9P5H5Y5_9HYPO|nr:hypothetical protein G7Z17_g8069 [Cylindrodendrum hubeiense]
MGGSHILVLGGTGPAGICLLRELLHRGHPTIAYARNPAKIPDDLSSNPLLQVIKGDMVDLPKLSSAIAQSSAIISMLGPNSLRMSDPRQFADFYSTGIFPLMREHSVSRILAMGTVSISDPQDKTSWIRLFLVLLVRVVAGMAYKNILNVANVFETEATGLDWTVYRIAGIPGGCDEASWRKDRTDGETFVGWVAHNGWSSRQKRAALTRWLVDAVEGGADEWIGMMPAFNLISGRFPNFQLDLRIPWFPDVLATPI